MQLLDALAGSRIHLQHRLGEPFRIEGSASSAAKSSWSTPVTLTCCLRWFKDGWVSLVPNRSEKVLSFTGAAQEPARLYGEHRALRGLGPHFMLRAVPAHHRAAGIEAARFPVGR